MEKKNKGNTMTIDDLAGIVGGQFGRLEVKMNKKFEQLETRMDKKFDQVHEAILELSTKTSYLDREISAIKHHLVYKEDFDDLSSRVKYLERKMGIVSGK